MEADHPAQPRRPADSHSHGHTPHQLPSYDHLLEGRTLFNFAKSSSSMNFWEHKQRAEGRQHLTGEGSHLAGSKQQLCHWGFRFQAVLPTARERKSELQEEI